MEALDLPTGLLPSKQSRKRERDITDTVFPGHLRESFPVPDFEFVQKPDKPDIPLQVGILPKWLGNQDPALPVSLAVSRPSDGKTEISLEVFVHLGKRRNFLFQFPPRRFGIDDKTFVRLYGHNERGRSVQRIKNLPETLGNRDSSFFIQRMLVTTSKYFLHVSPLSTTCPHYKNDHHIVNIIFSHLAFQSNEYLEMFMMMSSNLDLSVIRKSENALRLERLLRTERVGSLEALPHL